MSRRIWIVLAVIMALTMPAGAFQFRDEAFTLDIPENSLTYYYTQHGTNMTGTMLENAEKQAPLCLVGEYSAEGTLNCTFKAEYLDGTAQETAAGLAEMFSANYRLGEPYEDTLMGRDTWRLDGVSVQDDSYTARLYVLGDSPCLVITLMYAANQQGAAEGLLTGLTWPEGQTTQEKPPVQTPEVTKPKPAGDAPVAETLEPMVLPVSKVTYQSLTADGRGWPLWLPLVFVGVGAALAVLVLRKKRRHKPRHRERGRRGT